MMNIDDFSDTVARIYDASMDVDRWEDTLAVIASMFRSQYAQIAFGSPTYTNMSFHRISGIRMEQFPGLVQKYVELTPTDPRGPKGGAIFFKAWHCRQLISDEELWSSEMYKQVLVKIDMEYMMAFAFPLSDDTHCFFSAGRSRQDKPYTSEDCANYGRFAPHVSRALTMHGTFHRYRQDVDTARAAMDSVPLGMMVVNNDDVVLANKAARAMIEQGDAIGTRNGRLGAVAAQADAKLRDAMHEALSNADQPVGIALPTGEHQQPVRAVIRKLHPNSAGMLGTQNGSLAMYLTDPRRPIETSEEILQRLFGLTPREASVLKALVQGSDTHAIAGILGISQDTVRDHLKSIMQTTGTNRQADLVHLVLSSAAWVAGGTLG